MKFKFNQIIALALLFTLGSCGGVDKIYKSTDSDYKYEMAKQYFMTGHYNNASFLLSDVIASMKGTERGDESLFLYAMSKFRAKNFDGANESFKKFYHSYPTSPHVDEARFYAAVALAELTPLPQLDQTDTYSAITEFQNFIEIAPESKLVPKARAIIFELQDKLIEKEYLSSKLYYDLGDYFGNCTMGGNNYEACIKTAEAAIKDYPYSVRKEDFSILILRSKYHLAVGSVKEKMKDRYSETVDEYYGFVNEYPESKYMDEAKRIFEKAKAASNKTL